MSSFYLTILISNFIFVAYFVEFCNFYYVNRILEFLSPFISFFGFYKLLDAKKQIWFITGFFIGILWFYWITFSLIYFNLAYLIPFELLFIALVYGFLFLCAGFFNNLHLRILMLFALNFFYPFNFNWLMLDLTLSFGIFKANEISFLLLLFCLFILKRAKKWEKFLLIIPLLMAVNFNNIKPNYLPFEIELVNQDRSQSKIWDNEQIFKDVQDNIQNIQNAIDKNKKLIIFPESSFALFLNKEPFLMQTLQELSKKITIVTGALNYSDEKYYNSTYLFENTKVQIFNKHILVPFGEEIVLPNFIKEFINNLVFKADDFSKAESFSDYFIDKIRIRNAICYEVTRKELYKRVPKFIIAISNNAWFNYTIEPMMQKLIMQKFATEFRVTIYHSANGSKSEIITPKSRWF